MRICILGNAGSIHIQRWAEYFASKNHEVHLISSRSVNEINMNNVKLYHLRMSRLPINLLFSSVQLRKFIRQIRPDILHAHYISSLAFVGALSGFHPFVLSAWGSDVLVAPQNSRITALKISFCLRKADVTFATSQYLKEYIHKEFNLPQHSVIATPWGTDLETFHKGYEIEVKKLKSRLGIDEGDFVILSPRHLQEFYKIEYIVKAMPHIVAKYPNVVLILLKGAAKAADNEYEISVDNLCRELGISKNTRIMRKELKPHEMAVVYNASDVLISIPKSDLFGISIQEGMVCGVIPIVGELAMYHQYLKDGENALFVASEDAQQIAEKVIHCIENPELKERFHEINKCIIEEKENWNRNAQKIEELYESLVADNPKRDKY